MLKKKIINRYWLILLSELVLMFLVSMMDKHPYVVALFSLVMLLIALITIEICFELNSLRVSSIVFGAIAVLCGILWFIPWVPFEHNYIALFISFSSFSVFFLIAIVAIGRHVFMASRATINTIIGSICIYLLIGIFFSFIYAVSSLSLGGMFSVDGEPMRTVVEQPDLGLKEFVYFSFSTLATIGYGDIVPKDALTRMISYIEGIMGSLYLAVVVAKLVGMYVTQKIHVPGK